MTSTLADLSEVARSAATLRGFLHGLPGVDQVGAEARAATLATRSIKTTAKAWGIDLAIRMVDLTTLEGADTPGKVRSMCAKARRPDPSDASAPAVAAVCVYPDLVETAVEALRGSAVQVASVATAFPSGRASLATKLHDVRDAVAAGATEIDMVIDRGAFLAGRYLQVFEEIVATKAECGSAHLKVILETGELVTLDNVLRPMLIKRGANLPLLLIFAGVIGGLLAFGLVGIFVGPVVLAVAYTLLFAWLDDARTDRRR